MRILLVTNYQPPHMGGIEFAAGSLKRCWEEDGHIVTWLTTDVPRDGAPVSQGNLRLPAWNLFETLFQVNSPAVPPWHWGAVAEEVRRHDVVNVHSLAPGLSSLALRAAVKAHRPTVVTQHVGVIPFPWKPFGDLQERVICASARWAVLEHGVPLTFVGRAVRDWFVERAGLPADRVFMTPAGIDQHDFYFVTDEERAAFRRKWDLERNRLNVLFVGRFYQKKGLPLLHDVAARAPSAHFTFVGSGPLHPSRWGLPNVRVIPFASTAELRELYGSHDLFIMPSVGEGWPAVVPQAMACGLACLISEETFEGFGRDAEAFVIRPRTPEAIIRTLADIVAGRIPALNLRQSISDYARQTWDWKKTARIYIDLFEKTASLSTRPPRVELPGDTVAMERPPGETAVMDRPFEPQPPRITPPTEPGTPPVETPHLPGFGL